MGSFSGAANASPLVYTVDYSAAVGMAAQLIMTPANWTVAPQFMRIINCSATASIWLSRHLGAATAANAPGAYQLQPSQIEVWQIPQVIPLNPLWGIATAAGGALTVEIG